MLVNQYRRINIWMAILRICHRDYQLFFGCSELTFCYEMNLYYFAKLC